MRLPKMLIYFSDVGSRLWGGEGEIRWEQFCRDDKAKARRVLILSIQVN